VQVDLLQTVIITMHVS